MLTPISSHAFRNVDRAEYRPVGIVGGVGGPHGHGHGAGLPLLDGELCGFTKSSGDEKDFALAADGGADDGGAIGGSKGGSGGGGVGSRVKTPVGKSVSVTHRGVGQGRGGWLGGGFGGGGGGRGNVEEALLVEMA